jgi:hypothetical protein
LQAPPRKGSIGFSSGSARDEDILMDRILLSSRHELVPSVVEI